MQKLLIGDLHFDLTDSEQHNVSLKRKRHLHYFANSSCKFIPVAVATVSQSVSNNEQLFVEQKLCGAH